MNNKENTFVSAVIYIHNAENRIERFLDTVTGVLAENFYHSEIIAVNDGSNDDSSEKIKAVAKKTTGTIITLVNLSYFHGLEVAMNAGTDLAIGDFVFEFDNTVSDFTKEDVMNVFHRALEGYDIVSATPDRKQKLSSRMFYRLFAGFSQVKTRLCTESFRILSRRVINRISGMNKTVPYRKAVYANCGMKTDIIKYTPNKNIYEKAYDRAENIYRSSLAIDSLVLFTDLGYTIAKILTALMMAAAIFTALYSIIVFLVGTPVEGWTTTILFLSFSFFGLFGILTIIIKYLQILVNLVFKRKKYSFESIEKLT